MIGVKPIGRASVEREHGAWLMRLAAACGSLFVASAVAAGITRYSYRATAAVFGISILLLVLRYPFLGLLVVVASLPFETAGMLGNPDAAGAISITKIGGLATLGSVALDWLIRRTPLGTERIFSPLGKLVYGLCLITLAAAALHPTPESTKESIRFATIAMFFGVTVHLVDRERRMRCVIVTWVVVATVVSVQSLVQRRFGPTVGSEDWAPVAGTVIDVSEEGVGTMVRAAGSFTHPIWLALYLCVTTPLTLACVSAARSPMLRVAGCIAAVLQAAAVVATYSRMGYIALVLAFGMPLVRRRGGRLALLWIGLLALATTPLWPKTITARIQSIFDYTKSSSSVTRVGQQLVGWWMFRDHPVLGVGPGNFEESVERYADRVSDRYRVEKIGAHNLYVEVLAELGLPGLLLVLAILLVGWRAAQRARRAALDPQLRIRSEALGASLLVFAFCALFIHAQYQKEWWLLMALLASAESLTGVSRDASDNGAYGR